MNIVVIPGAKQIKYVEENLGADKLELTKEETEKIRMLANELNWGAVGERYGPGMQYDGVETPALKE